MKKIMMLFMGLALVAGPVYGKELATLKGAGDVTVKVSLLNDPPVVGKNKVKIEVMDADGKRVTDAKVRVYYSMVPMGGMTPMEYKAKAKLEGDGYIASLDIMMKGHWNLKFRVKRKGGKSINGKARFMVK